MSPPSSCSISTLAAARETRNEPLRHHVVLEVPVLATVVSSSGLESDEPGVVDHEVEAAEGEHGRVDHRLHGVLVADVARRRRSPRRCRRSRRRPSCALSRSRSAITTQAPSAASRSAIALPMPRAGAGDQRDPGGERLGLRHPLQLGLLERPVLDAELLRLVDRRVRRDALGAAHHVDRVDVELAGHAGGLLVLAVAEHADAGHQHDQRVGAADGRRVRRRRCGRSSPGSPRGRARAAP